MIFGYSLSTRIKSHPIVECFSFKLSSKPVKKAISEVKVLDKVKFADKTSLPKNKQIDFADIMQQCSNY